MSDRFQNLFPTQLVPNETSIGGPWHGRPREWDIALNVKQSATIDRVRVNVEVIVPNTFSPVVGPTGKTTELQFPVGSFVEAEVPSRGSGESYTPSDAAQVLGMSEEEVMWWVEAGLIPGWRRGNRVGVSAAWLNRYRPTAQAVKWMGVSLSTEELTRKIRLGRRSWAWPPLEQAHDA